MLPFFPAYQKGFCLAAAFSWNEGVHSALSNTKQPNNEQGRTVDLLVRLKEHETKYATHRQFKY